MSLQTKPVLQINDDVKDGVINAVFRIDEISQDGKLAKIVCEPQKITDVVPISDLIFVNGYMVGRQYK